MLSLNADRFAGKQGTEHRGKFFTEQAHKVSKMCTESADNDLMRPFKILPSLNTPPIRSDC